MTLSLSFDHRLVDGEQASRFLTAVGDILREPGVRCCSCERCRAVQGVASAA
jgi:hypothetical protein